MSKTVVRQDTKSNAASATPHFFALVHLSSVRRGKHRREWQIMYWKMLVLNGPKNREAYMIKERFHNKAEEYVNFVNDNIFLKEFTYSDNEIKIVNGEIELADNFPPVFCCPKTRVAGDSCNQQSIYSLVHEPRLLI